jgi:hypothetical protein
LAGSGGASVSSEGVECVSEDRRIDAALRHRLDEIQDEYRRLARRNWGAIQQLARRTYGVLAVVAAVSFACGGVSVYLIGEDAKRGHEIQEQRVNAALTVCRDQNRRHDRTIGRLDIAIRRIKDPAEHARALANRRASSYIISALAPHRNCRRVVRMIVPHER